MYYPVILIPKDLAVFLERQKVRLPTYEKPQRQQLILLLPLIKSPVLWGSVGAVVGLAASIFIKKAQWNWISFSLVILGIVTVVMGLWTLKQWLKQYYKEQQKEYSEKLERWEKTQRLMQRYQQSKEYINVNGRAAQLKELLQGKVLQPVGDSAAQQGVSEKQFFEVLKGYFRDKVSFGGEFPIPGSQFKYSHDIVFIDSTTGLYIDIEIDEPYEGKSKQPHHCIDDDKDKRRNQYFLEGNWVIVRFAEEQIVRYPHACCKSIAETIALITGNKGYLKGLEDVEPLPLVKCWTSWEAKRMASWKVRERYLEEMGVFKQMSDRSKNPRKKRYKNQN